MKHFLLLLSLLTISLWACLPSTTTRWLTADEMGVVPTAFSEENKPRPRDLRDACYQQDNYIVDTTRLEDYPIQYVRINVHWMNSQDEQNNIPESEAEAHTMRILHAMNYALENNKKMYLPNGNDTPIHPVNIRYVLTGRSDDPNDKGIYYHYDDSLYYYVHIRRRDSNLFDRDVFDKYGVQMDTVLNLFFMPHHPDSVASNTYKGGRVGVALRNALKVAANWRQDYERDPKDCHWRYRGVINHEVGHILGLSHAWGNDGCDDTPKHPNRCYGKESGPGCDTMMSNNLMDYSALQLAWTPCQIGRVHRRLNDLRSQQRKFLLPTWCTNDSTAAITVTDSVDWACMRDLRGPLTIAEGGTLTIRCRTSIPEDGRIVIAPGGELILDGGYLYQDCGETWRGIQVQKRGEEERRLTILNGGEVRDVALE